MRHRPNVGRLPPLPAQEGWLLNASDPDYEGAYWLEIQKDDDYDTFEDDLAAAESLSPVVMMYCPELGIFAPQGIPEDLVAFHWETVIPNPKKFRSAQEAIQNAKDETLTSLGFRV